MPILTNSNNLVRATSPSWQHHLKTAVRSAAELIALLDLPVNSICPKQTAGNFPLFVTRPFLGRICKGDLDDPLLKQVLPMVAESDQPEGYSLDPLNESEFHVKSGLLDKYNGRALLVVNGTCAIHCRYCFRRHFPYSQATGVETRWQSASELIEQDDTIEEIILSGGDPLTLVDDQLEQLIDRLATIEHLQRLRIHSRLPVVIPSRITERLISMLQSTRLAVVFVVHCNHGQEIDDEVRNALKSLSEVCTAVLNQSVLLRGVNDSVNTLVGLSDALFSSNVLPYYLHQLDSVQGAAHFEVDQQIGIELVNKMRTRLPGYLVPRYVKEIPGQPSKTIIA